MKTKKCNKCNEIKAIENFHFRNKTKGYLNPICKTCKADQMRNIYKNNSNLIKEKAKKRFKQKYNEDPEFKEKHKASSKRYRKNNKELVKENNRKYQQKQDVKQRKNKLNKEKYQKNGLSKKRKEYFKKYMKEYNKTYRNKPECKIRDAMSKGIRKSLKSKKEGSWKNLVNYTLEELMYHLEKQFKPGMTFENHGLWHIDHIIPVSSFKITSNDCDEFKKCWDLNNLQPLWAKENLQKGSKIL